MQCDESGPPCRPCSGLGVECTFSREMKRRGPPNRHAQAARAVKQARLELNSSGAIGSAIGNTIINNGSSHHMSPSPHNAAETLVSIAAYDGAGRALDAEAIAPWDILALLVDDFFTYIHPLIPFPHEPTFRQSFHSREDRTDRKFLALLSSMIGCLVASFPRSAQLRLKSQHGAGLFPHAMSMIERCRLVALEARGSFFYDEEKHVYDAATSYFLALAAGYTFQWKLFRRFMAEAMSFLQELGYHRPRDQNQQLSALQLEHGQGEQQRPFSHIEDQMGKRIFWIMLLGIRLTALPRTPRPFLAQANAGAAVTRSMTQLGAPANELPAPATH